MVVVEELHWGVGRMMSELCQDFVVASEKNKGHE